MHKKTKKTIVGDIRKQLNTVYC